MVRPQPSDIDSCISVSMLRCIYSVIGILLALTDIPRTGLAVNLSSFFTVVAPGTVMYYGPYAYPVVHLNRANPNSTSDDSNIQAFAGDTPVDSVDVWAYKFDTLSIPTRALAEQLNVSSYPRCLLYEKQCDSTSMKPGKTFTILNDLLTAIQRQYFNKDAAAHKMPLVFETISYWSDRLHHVVFGKLGHRRDHRIHSVRHFTSGRSLKEGALLGVDICEALAETGHRRPMVCILPVRWMSAHPTLRTAAPVPLQESIRLRFSLLQHRYPDAVLEMMVITTKSSIESRSDGYLPVVYYNSENLEVTTLIRGRRCPPGGPCRVEFIDDYRYERATVETSSHELKYITGSLRALAQSYIWLRMLLLVSVCCQSRLAESSVRSNSKTRKAMSVVLTLLRIPSHTIIYSGWLPVIAYSAAHFMDCGLVHLVTDSFWASSNGFVDFDFVEFILVASIQMRNAWFIALVWKSVIFVCSRVFTNRSRAWRPQDGVFAFRGVFIGTISSLTTLSFMPRPQFRNTKVLEFVEIPRHFGPTKLLLPAYSRTKPDFGPWLDVKTIFAASIVVFSASFLLQQLLRCVCKASTRFVACQNYYVPLTAGKLFPASALNVFWLIRLVPKLSGSTHFSSSPRSRSVAPFFSVFTSKTLKRVVPVDVKSQPRHCDVCNFIPAPLYWQTTQGCTRHERIFSVGSRSVELQSMIRLVNIGMLSDPIVFIRLRLFGCRLQLHQIPRSRLTTPRHRLPQDDQPCVAQANSLSEDSFVLVPASVNKENRAGWQLVAAVNSRDVPWGLLVDCG